MQRGTRTVALFFLMLALGVLCAVVPLPASFAQDEAPLPAGATQSTAQRSAASPSDSDKQMCTVAGTVTGEATGEPLRRARVVLAGQRSQNYSGPQLVITDGAGHFSIDHVRPGRYSLVVERDGYLPAQYGQGDPDKLGSVLSLVAGQKKMTDLVFRLQRMAVITGRVVDEDGQPMARAAVEALRRTRSHGSSKLEPAESAQTDDLGVYRIFDLSPGRYVVRATPNSPSNGVFVFGNDDSPDNSLQQPPSEYPPTYFPGTIDAARASTLDVKAGDEIPRVDFSFAPSAPVKTYRIRGRLTNAIAGQSQGMLMVMAIPRNPDSATLLVATDLQLVARPDPKTGAFTINGVPPGAYIVVASSIVVPGEKIRTATQEVDVIDADVDSVSLVLTRGADISGRVTFEGKAAASAEETKVSIASKDEEFAFGAQQDDDVEKDGSFAMTEVGDGTYSISIHSKCEDCYTKSVTANGMNLLDTGMVVKSGQGPSSIDIVYSSNTGKASGAVTGADDLPVPGAYVMLIKDEGSRKNIDDTKTATTDQYGKFEIRGVPPGRYKALAWAKFDAESYNDPDFIKPFAAKAELLEVDAGATATVRLKAITATASDAAN